jgi:uncharacterized OsmC-like protein
MATFQTMASADVREYEVGARSTDVFGRVLANARDQHLVVDGPVQNGCPGEAITPAETFLTGVATCGVELLQVLARARDVPLRSVRVSIRGVVDRSRPVRSDVTVFNSVHIAFVLEGVSEAQAAELVDGFKRR